MRYHLKLRLCKVSRISACLFKAEFVSPCVRRDRTAHTESTRSRSHSPALIHNFSFTGDNRSSGVVRLQLSESNPVTGAIKYLPRVSHLSSEMSNLSVEAIQRARVFHIPLKIKARPVIPAEIDPLIFYAAANDKGPFHERNERAFPFPGRTIDIIFTHALVADGARVSLNLFPSRSSSNVARVKLSGIRVNMYIGASKRVKNGSIAGAMVIIV